MNNDQGLTVWFTGLPCCGKTTMADQLAKGLTSLGKQVERLDGDIVRETLCRDLGFSKEDRGLNLERITFVSKMLTRNGVYVLTTFVSPYRIYRDRARKEINNFIEVFVKCPLKVCEQRDVKGMYKKARAGEIKDFTGIDDPYEDPKNPELIVDSDKHSVEECTGQIMDYLKSANKL